MRKSEDVRERWLAIPDEFSLEGIIADSREEAERYAKDVICVVEKSAYDRLKAERDELVRKLADSEKACHELWESATDRDMSLIKERDTAVKALGRALELIEQIYEKCDWYANIHQGPDIEVHHALKVEIPDEINKCRIQIKSLGILPEGEGPETTENEQKVK